MKSKFRRYNKRTKSGRALFAKSEDAPFFPAQAKLNVGEPGDKYEQEADNVADLVVSGTQNIVSNNVQSSTAIGKKELQEKSISENITPLIQQKEEHEGIMQMQAEAEEEEVVQTQAEEDEEEVQAQVEEEEEPVQTKEEEEEEPVQAKEEEEEEPVQAKEEEEEEPVQMQEEEEEEPVQMQEEEEEELQAKSNNPIDVKPSVESRLKSSSGKGTKMDKATRTEMERGFGADFNNVNIHTDESAVQMSKEMGAQAFTHGNDVYFNKGKYNPDSSEGKHLLAHELTHTIQQNGKTDLNVQSKGKGQLSENSINGTQPIIQRREYDPKENLQSRRFKGNVELESVYDDKSLIFNGRSGEFVIQIQRALMDLGYSLEKYQDDGIFGSETEKAVRNFQSDNPPALIDGIVGPETLRLLDLQALKLESGEKEKKEEDNIDEAEKTILEKVEEELKKGSGDKRAEYALCLLNLYKEHRSDHNIYDKYMGPTVMWDYIDRDRGDKNEKTYRHPSEFEKKSSFRTLDRAVSRNSATFIHNLLSEANYILEGMNVVSIRNRYKKDRLWHGTTLDFLYDYINTRMLDNKDIYSCFK